MFRRSIQIFCHLQVRYTSRSNLCTLIKNVENLQSQRIAGYRLVLKRNYSENETDKSDATDALKATQSFEKFSCVKENPSTVRKLQMLELEIDIMRNDGELVPKNLMPQQWMELLECNTRSQKRKALQFFWLKERLKQKYERRKQMKIVTEKERLEDLNINTTSSLMYGLGHNTMFIRIYEKTMNNYFRSRLFNAMMYGSTLIFDFAFSYRMNKKEVINCARQLTMAFSDNRTHTEPLYWHFCNVDKSDPVIAVLKRQIPQLYDDDFPISISQGPPTSIYDKSRLVYLTPDSPNVLTTFNANDVYIIGAFVDKIARKSVTLMAAKSYNIRHARFPLEKIQFTEPNLKSLTINQVHSILSDLNLTGDWIQALNHVPHRKLLEAQTRRKNYKLAMSNLRFQKSIAHFDDELNDDSVKFGEPCREKQQ